MAATYNSKYADLSAVCFSSLFIGIVAATSYSQSEPVKEAKVSVPYSLGLWLQPANGIILFGTSGNAFQFPIHWDCGCNSGREQLPEQIRESFSSLFIGIVAATLIIVSVCFLNSSFQFPIHWDCGCNYARVKIT